MTNLAAGALSDTSTDAVNGSQLKSVADQVNKNTGDIDNLATAISNVTENSLVKQDGATEDITIGANKGGTFISVTGTQGERTLTGVRAGVNANDAATVGQLQAVSGNISSRDVSNRGIAKATGKDSLAVGAGATAAGDESVSMGSASQATGVNSSAMGASSSAIAQNATAVGHKSIASGGNSTALGQNSKALGINSLAMGNQSNASGSNSVALGQGSIAERDNTVSAGSVGNERQITNVAAGTAPMDAANVGQVNNAFQSLGREMNKRINDLDDKLTAGVASAMAMSGIPQAYLPDSSLVGASVSTYKGQSAIAVGVSKTSEDGKWILKVNGSGNTQSDFGASAGVGYQW
ncbi:YadA family autotransporter adhesin [Serratia fonticola]